MLHSSFIPLPRRNSTSAESVIVFRAFRVACWIPPSRFKNPLAGMLLCFAIAISMTTKRLEAQTNEPPPKRERVLVETNIPYAQVDGQTLLCDIYLPKARAKTPPPQQQFSAAPDSSAPAEQEFAPLPAVLVIHGGAWASGNKMTIGTHARALAEAGMVAVSINYRLAPDHKFPRQLDDVRAALVWMGENAARYSIDPQRIGLFGYSAGGHLSCLVGTLHDAPWEVLAKTSQWPQEDPRWRKLPKVKAVVGGGTPCDFRDVPLDSDALSYFFGGAPRECPEVYLAASPTHHASSGDVPMLLIHGNRDMLVPLASSERLCTALRAAGATAELHVLDGPGHMLAFFHPELRKQTIRFLSSQLGIDGEPNEP